MSEEAGVQKPPTPEEIDEQQIERLRRRGYFVREDENRYDRTDRVRRLMVVNAGPLKFGAYQVRDPETDAWSPVQFHLLYDNHVMAVLSEQSAKLFCTLYSQVMEKHPAPCPGDKAQDSSTEN